MVAETEPVGSVVVASADNFTPLLRFQADLARELPEAVDAHFLLAQGNPFDEVFKDKFDSGQFHAVPGQVDSNWVRDYFPEVVRKPDATFGLTRFQYPRPDLPLGGVGSEQAATAFAAKLGLPLYESQLVLEGGNLMADGKGRLFTTEKVLRQNAGMSPAEVEVELKRALGVTEVVWLPMLPFEGTGTSTCTRSW
jgi:agmatine/peptidylarginine deiminase